MVMLIAWGSLFNKGQGRENAKQYLKEHPDVMAEVEGTLRELYCFDAAPDTEE